jgi:hypothetical protein
MNELPRSPATTSGIFDRLWGKKNQYPEIIRCCGQHDEMKELLGFFLIPFYESP